LGNAASGWLIPPIDRVTAIAYNALAHQAVLSLTA